MKKIIAICLLITSLFLASSPAFAQTKLTDTDCLKAPRHVEKVINPDGSVATDDFGNDKEVVVVGTKDVATIDCFPIIMANVVFWLLIFVGVVALILIILSGFKFVASGGDPKQAEGARKTLTFAIIGMVLVLLSFSIVAFIAKTTGMGCITKFGFTQCTKECTRRSECPLNTAENPRRQECTSEGRCVLDEL